MKKEILIDEKKFDTLTELVSGFHKAFLNAQPARTNSMTDIQIRTMMLVKARQVCKKIPTAVIGECVYQVSKSVVLGAPKMHKRFLEESIFYKNIFEVFSTEVDEFIKNEKIVFS